MLSKPPTVHASILTEPTSDLPFVTEPPGVGGTIRETCEDFRVVEIPAYEPAGEGDHVFAVMQKRGLTTSQAVALVAQALGVRPADCGTAGMKDKYAVTTQTVSFPSPVTPEAALAVTVPGIEILSATRHGHKLRTGHVRANAFRLVIRNPSGPSPAETVLNTLNRLAEQPGIANWYGPQRFGARGDNALIGFDILAGTNRRIRGHKRKLFVSALQSALFNAYVRERMARGLTRVVLRGDVLKKTDTGGMFTCVDADVDTARLLAGEVTLTGPMFGNKMSGGPAASELEAHILHGAGVDPELFARGGKLCPGTRRQIFVPLQDVTAEPVDAGVAVEFTLPAGSYATTVLREIMKTDAFPR